MNQIIWVDANDALPNVDESSNQDVIAAGLDLSPSRLAEAYSKGMFPWFSEGEPVLWWSPDPRLILRCDEIKVSKSLAKLLRKIQRAELDADAQWKITTNTVFPEVIKSCANLTESRSATWITGIIKNTYGAWHKQGHVNSIEVWCDNKLVGGLYGVLLGRFFFGESMFSKLSNASKIALYYLTRLLISKNINIIDCQQETPHLCGLGATTITRTQFLDELKQQLQYPTPFWQPGQVIQSGAIIPLDQVLT